MPVMPASKLHSSRALLTGLRMKFISSKMVSKMAVFGDRGVCNLKLFCDHKIIYFTMSLLGLVWTRDSRTQYITYVDCVYRQATNAGCPWDALRLLLLVPLRLSVISPHSKCIVQILIIASRTIYVVTYLVTMSSVWGSVGIASGWGRLNPPTVFHPPPPA